MESTLVLAALFFLATAVVGGGGWEGSGACGRLLANCCSFIKKGRCSTITKPEIRMSAVKVIMCFITSFSSASIPMHASNLPLSFIIKHSKCLVQIPPTSTSNSVKYTLNSKLINITKNSLTKFVSSWSLFIGEVQHSFLPTLGLSLQHPSNMLFMT